MADFKSATVDPKAGSCEFRIICPGETGLDSEAPLANFSSEAPDVRHFFGYNYGTSFPPNLGWNWGQPPTGVCVATTPEEAANCTAPGPPDGGSNQQTPTGGGTSHGGPWTDPSNNPVPVFHNAAQTCSYTCPDGSPFTWTVPAGAVTATTQALADQRAQSIACNNARTYHICFPDAYLPFCANIYGESSIKVQGNNGPYSFSVSGGALPPGVTLATSQTDSTVAIISGTPGQAGNASFTLRATDAYGNHMDKGYVAVVLGMNGTTPAGTYGHAYSASLAASGGTAPYSYGIPNGSLPPGLSLNGSTGVISGAPTTLGTYKFTAQVTDASDPVLTCSKDFTITVGPSALYLNGVSAGKIELNPDPVLTYGIISGVLYFGDTIAGAPQRVSGESVGTYPINQGTLSAGPKYTITFIPGIFTIQSNLMVLNYYASLAANNRNVRGNATFTPAGDDAAPCGGVFTSDATGDGSTDGLCQQQGSFRTAGSSYVHAVHNYTLHIVLDIIDPKGNGIGGITSADVKFGLYGGSITSIFGGAKTAVGHYTADVNLTAGSNYSLNYDANCNSKVAANSECKVNLSVTVTSQT